MLINLLVFLFTVLLIFCFMWVDEKSKKDNLERILFRLDKKIDLLDKVKPNHYVPSRHFNIARQMNEKVSLYQEITDYEQLQIAVRNGSYSSQK